MSEVVIDLRSLSKERLRIYSIKVQGNEHSAISPISPFQNQLALTQEHTLSNVTFIFNCLANLRDNLILICLHLYQFKRLQRNLICLHLGMISRQFRLILLQPWRPLTDTRVTIFRRRFDRGLGLRRRRVLVYGVSGHDVAYRVAGHFLLRVETHKHVEAFRGYL